MELTSCIGIPIGRQLSRSGQSPQLDQVQIEEIWQYLCVCHWDRIKSSFWQFRPLLVLTRLMPLLLMLEGSIWDSHSGYLLMSLISATTIVSSTRFTLSFLSKPTIW